MSPIVKRSTDVQGRLAVVKPYLLPAYIVISALFILYIGYLYFQNSVYGVGFQNGQQSGYETAIVQLVNELGTQCTPTSINSGETTINVINVACLQQQNASNVQETGTDVNEE